MPLYVPGTDNLYESGLDNLIQAVLNRNAVIPAGGCQVVAHAAPDMGVRVLAGTIQGGGIRVAVAQTDLVVAANPGSNSRIDLVSINFTTGIPTITAGTAAPTPKPPAMLATDILAGYVTVPPTAVNIQNANITDRRLFLPSTEVYPVSPNLVLNSDFGRRTVFGLAMPEAFADTSGYALVSGTPTVGANILTFNAANNFMVWPKVGTGTFWRDGRGSATFKAVTTTDSFLEIFHYADANNYIRAGFDGAGFFFLGKVIGGTPTSVASVAQAATLNRWYWGEIEAQSTTYIAKLYDTGGTVSGVTKASSTLLQTLTGAIADAAVQLGGQGFTSSSATCQAGGIATGNGGVYVETWLPESFTWAGVFGGTLGGQAVAIDETADVGPLSKQAALRFYIPAAGRTISVASIILPDGSVPFSTAMTHSTYMKVSGLGGSGELIQTEIDLWTSALGLVASFNLSNGSGTSWTRQIDSRTVGATVRRAGFIIRINSATTATGTAYFALPQLEQGSAATAWRNAPADDAPLGMNLISTPAALTQVGLTEIDPRDLATNFYMPWDGAVEINVTSFVVNGGLNQNGGCVYVDGSAPSQYSATQASFEQAVAGKYTNFSWKIRVPLQQGKHRIALRMNSAAGTLSFSSNPQTYMTITATRGK